MFEPLDTMAETTLALCSGDPAVLTGRIAFSLQLLVELKRPVLDLHGERLVDGWQPADLPAVIARQEENLAKQGWPSTHAAPCSPTEVAHLRLFHPRPSCVPRHAGVSVNIDALVGPALRSRTAHRERPRAPSGR